jgi:hypothetical protein
MIQKYFWTRYDIQKRVPNCLLLIYWQLFGLKRQFWPIFHRFIAWHDNRKNQFII